MAFDAAFGMRHSLVISSRNIPYAIAERAEDVSRAASLPPHAEITRMGELAQAMLHDALDAFVIDGIQHNIPFLTSLHHHPRWREGNLSTGFMKSDHVFSPL